MDNLEPSRRRRDQGDPPPALRSRTFRWSAGGKKPPHDPTVPPERAASFHGRTAAAAQAVDQSRQIRRHKTLPDLLAGIRMSAAGAMQGAPSSDGGGWAVEQRRVPAKVLVNVTVQRSLLGPLQVMASTEWTVAELVADAVRLYVKEGRRPKLPPATDPSAAFRLHYSQFSLEGLDPKEKMFGLGSRNFFLCLKPDGSTSFLLRRQKLLLPEQETNLARSWPKKLPSSSTIPG